MAKRPGDITPSGARDTGLTRGSTDIEKFTDSTVSTDAEDDRDLEMAGDDAASEETEQIKAQIEETRAGLGETIDAIQERLSFSNISEQVSEQVNSAIESAKDSVYEATIGKVAHFMKNTGKEISRSSLVSTAKENPLPFILIGVGAGLLAYQGFGRSNTSRRNVRYGATPRLMGRQERREDSPSTMARAQSGIGSLTDTVSSTVSGAAGTVKDSVSNVANTAYDGVSRAAESTYSGVSNLANRATETASNLGSRAAETYEHYLEEKPWAIGAVALVAGAAIGMAIPSSRYEGDLMGEARVKLLDKVSDTATELVDKAKQAAGEVGKTVSNEAKALTDETLG